MVGVVVEQSNYNVTVIFEGIEKRVNLEVIENVFNVQQSTFENANINGGIIY